MVLGEHHFTIDRKKETTLKQQSAHGTDRSHRFIKEKSQGFHKYLSIR